MTGPTSIDLRFALPDVAHVVPYQELPDGRLHVTGEGTFAPCLLPLHLSGGLRLVLGTWLRGADSTLANDVPPFGLLGAEVTVSLREPEELPWVDGSPDPQVTEILTAQWDRDEVLGLFDQALPVAVRTRLSDEWLLERSPGLAARVVDGTMQFAGPGRTVYADQLVDELVRAPEEFLGDLIADAPEVPPEQISTHTEGDEVRHAYWLTTAVDGQEQHELYGFVVRPGAALAVSCFHDDPADHAWALHVLRSATYLG